MEYYSALKKEILTHAITWMNFEDIIHKPDTKGQIVSHSTYEVTRIVKFIETENRIGVPRGWGEAYNRKLLFTGYSVSSVWNDE